MAKVLLSLEKEYGYGTFSLGVMDYYQMVHQLDTFKNLQLPKNTQIHNQNDLYRGWQAQEEDPTLISKLDIEAWGKANCRLRTLEEIAAGNQLVRQWERTQYTLPITPYWEKRVLHDTILWCEDYFEKFKPTVVVSIERFELANSIFYEICKRENIPMLTFVGSRIGSRWILRDDFGYGMSNATIAEVESASKNLDAMQEAKNIVAKMEQENLGSYNSDSRILASGIKQKRNQKMLQVLKESRKLAGNIYARHFIEPRNYALTVRRFEENHFKLTKYLLRRHLLRSARLFGYFTIGLTIPPKEPYLFWALHYRPETSGLVLGDGRDEIAELIKVANSLPSDWVLAVKENSLMVGERFPGFYKKLKRIENVRLIDANADTIELIKKSQGVVGISGTVLLEAAALGKPSCALGSPEFNQMLTHTGWHSFNEFLRNLLDGNEFQLNDQANMVKYIAYVVAKSEDNDAKYLSNEDSPELELMLNRFGREIHNYLTK